MSVKVDVKRFTDKIEKLLGESVSARLMRPVAQELAKIIVKRTRLGYGVSSDLAEKSKLKASGPGGKFTPKYLLRRIRARAKGELASTTTPNKLNLTFTGQLLESIKVIKAEDGQIIIGPTGTRKPDNGGKKKKKKKTKTNEEIAQYNADAGRIFLNVSRLEFQQILRFYRREFTDLRKKLGLIGRK